MKKVLSVVLLLALLLTFAGCGAAPEETVPPTEASVQETEAPAEADTPAVPEVDPFQYIDETVPVDGVYKVHSLTGVENMLAHPEGNFEILKNIDLAGAELTSPEGVFTGEVLGGNFVISNFTLKPAANGNVGLLGELQGAVKDLTLTNVTLVAGENSRYIGSIAAINKGTVTRCNVTGVINAEKAAENAVCGGAVGANSGEISNGDFNVDVNFTAGAAATAGGLCGTMEGGLLANLNSGGGLVVTGTNKTLGLYAGSARDGELKNVSFVGPVNTLDGQLYTAIFGAEENMTLSGCSWRDNSAEPLPENVQALRDRVVEEMHAMATVRWQPSQTLYHDCTCSLNVCHGAYTAGITYVGLPYNHKGGNVERLEYCKDENGILQDWVYELPSFDGFDSYVGNDCSTAVLHAWWTVSNSVDFLRTRFQNPAYRGAELGVIAVGDWAYQEYLGTYNSKPYIEASGETAVYESYALMHKGDVIFYNPENVGGHTKMVVSEPVVVRYLDGTINPELSYVLTSEQGVGEVYDQEANTITTWAMNTKMTFASLLFHEALPITCEELLTGEMEPAQASVENCPEGKLGMFTGTVHSNYYMNHVNLKITDSQGNVTFEKILFPTVGKFYDSGANDTLIRNYVDEYDLAHFSTTLQEVRFEKGETYQYTITVGLATGDEFTVKEGAFTQGIN